MLLSNAPAKIPLPFASAGAKNTIPEASQIGITPGAASLTDGFPPLTRTPLAGGGVPPSGLDFNGILFELSAVIRWANAGGGYPYDSAFVSDSNVGGYPKGARVLRSDGVGYWFNTTDNNTTDPESGGAVAAGWVPDFTTGATSVAMTSANVTLTALQYGKPVIVVTGALTANLNLIFPTMIGEWVVINQTTGGYAVTCKTASGTGVVVNSTQTVAGDGTNIYSSANDAISALGELIYSAGGTADALTFTAAPVWRQWPAGVPFWLRAASANATTTPTVQAGSLSALTIVKGSNQALAIGDIAGAGHWLQLQYDVTLTKAVLQNPATGVSIVASQTVQGSFKNLQANSNGTTAAVNVSADELVVENAAHSYLTLRSLSLTANTAAASGAANSLDTGAWAFSTWYYVFVINNGATSALLFSLSATAPTLPSGYTYFARVGAIRTQAATSYYPLAFKQYGRRVQYVVVSASNVASLPLMSNGVVGTWSTTAPTYVAISTSNFIPTTAASLRLLATANYNGLTGSSYEIAPNSSYSGPFTTNPPPISNATGPSQVTQIFDFAPESSNLYAASSAAGFGLFCFGWEDNL